VSVVCDVCIQISDDFIMIFITIMRQRMSSDSEYTAVHEFYRFLTCLMFTTVMQ
jgi:hypothetical protein